MSNKKEFPKRLFDENEHYNEHARQVEHLAFSKGLVAVMDYAKKENLSLRDVIAVVSLSINLLATKQIVANSNRILG
ncbi:MAG: hypothetical protein RL621_323 [Bacteroidota bacterium]|jgi:hypothetical protein